MQIFSHDYSRTDVRLTLNENNLYAYTPDNSYFAPVLEYTERFLNIESADASPNTVSKGFRILPQKGYYSLLRIQQSEIDYLVALSFELSLPFLYKCMFYITDTIPAMSRSLARTV